MAERSDKEHDERAVRREENAAAAEAARIGGETGMEDVDPARRASYEAGGGEAEGFEQAEELLERHASHDRLDGNPLLDRPTPERERPRAEYGEADHVESTETDEDTAGTRPRRD